MVDIIIPCWIIDKEILSYTIRCIDSFEKHCSNYNLVIVDNASTLGISYMKDKGDVYIRNRENVGYGPAVNQGIKASSGEWVVVSNNDIEVLDDWVSIAQEAWCDGVGAISSHLLDHDPKRRVGIEEAPKGHMFGALWMTKRDIIESVGLLDESYIMGMFEDRDLWERIERAGYHFRKVGHVNHVGNASWGKLAGRHKIYLRNKSLFEQKWK